MISSANADTVVGLDSIAARNISVVGGKGANLGQLAQAWYTCRPPSS